MYILIVLNSRKEKASSSRPGFLRYLKITTIDIYCNKTTMSLALTLVRNLYRIGLDIIVAENQIEEQIVGQIPP